MSSTDSGSTAFRNDPRIKRNSPSTWAPGRRCTGWALCITLVSGRLPPRCGRFTINQIGGIIGECSPSPALKVQGGVSAARWSMLRIRGTQWKRFGGGGRWSNEVRLSDLFGTRLLIVAIHPGLLDVALLQLARPAVVFVGRVNTDRLDLVPENERHRSCDDDCGDHNRHWR